MTHHLAWCSNVFYYNPKGCDNNGNFGPDENDPGWIVVDFSKLTRKFDLEDVIPHLPQVEQEKVRSYMAKWTAAQQASDEKYGTVYSGDDKAYAYSLRGFLDADAGWGVGFTLTVEQYFTGPGGSPPMTVVEVVHVTQ